MENKEDYLLEFGTEELPASVVSQWVRGQREQLESGESKPLITKDALAKRWRLNSLNIYFYATPRRLALYVQGLSAKQSEEIRRIKGPPVSVAFSKDGKPTVAAAGFCKSQQTGIEDLEKDEDGYVYITKRDKGKSAIEILPEIAREVFDVFSLPKTMRWGNNSLRFSRPIRWIVSLYGDRVVEIELNGINAGRTTRGHRFLFPGEKELKDSSEYVSVLEANGVLVDNRRKDDIKQQIIEIKREKGLIPVSEGFEELLEEVANMVEKPRVVVGSFSDKFLSMPKEVLYTSMRSHQRYFPVENVRGNISSHFIVVHNASPEADKIVIKGNERVLSARLEDAHFFYYEDCSKNFEEFAQKLEGLVFHDKLGTMFQKAERLQELSEEIGKKTGSDNTTLSLLKRAAYLAKADLLTQMVIEFPVLQGTMGKEYALKSGEESTVAEAIFEHYLPKSRSRSARKPQSNMGTIIALADKIDSASSLLLFEKPTASKDPYGIRRYLTGLVRIILEKKLDFGIYPLIEMTMLLLERQGIKIHHKPEDAASMVSEIILGEVLAYKTVQGVRRREAFAVISAFKKRGFGKDVWIGDLNIMLVAALIDHMQSLSDDFLNDIVEPYIRCRNLSDKKIGYIFYKDQMGEPETKLKNKLIETEKQIMANIDKRDFSKAVMLLGELRQDIDSFFDDVLIMVKEEKTRHNRIAILNLAVSVYEKYADFSELQL